jgi:2-amino-4-hydroxy-6-hydroxymethyldihydropteridine diphosphokinase / dihydropteroate synthase
LSKFRARVNRWGWWLQGRLGREQGGQRWGPRPLDIDILFYEDWQLHEKDLQVPHARWRERSFVKAPLGDLEAPAGPHPSPLTSMLGEAHSLWESEGGSLIPGSAPCNPTHCFRA